MWCDTTGQRTDEGTFSGKEPGRTESRSLPPPPFGLLAGIWDMGRVALSNKFLLSGAGLSSPHRTGIDPFLKMDKARFCATSVLFLFLGLRVYGMWNGSKVVFPE